MIRKLWLLALNVTFLFDSNTGSFVSELVQLDADRH